MTRPLYARSPGRVQRDAEQMGMTSLSLSSVLRQGESIPANRARFQPPHRHEWLSPCLLRPAVLSNRWTTSEADLSCLYHIE